MELNININLNVPPALLSVLEKFSGMLSAAGSLSSTGDKQSTTPLRESTATKKQAVEPVTPQDTTTETVIATETTTPTAQKTDKKSSTKTPEPAPGEPPETTIDLITLRAAFAEKLKAGKKTAIKNIFTELGATGLNDLSETDYARAYEMIKAVA